MNKVQNLVLKLNEMLEDESFTSEACKISLSRFKEQFKAEFKFLDFKYYNNYRLRFAKLAKIKCVETQDFEAAAKFRDLENDCTSFISLKNEYGIEKSSFYYDRPFLFYFYLGTAKNDKAVRDYFKKFS
jgi:hypothetical protein